MAQFFDFLFDRWNFEKSLGRTRLITVPCGVSNDWFGDGVLGGVLCLTGTIWVPSTQSPPAATHSISPSEPSESASDSAAAVSLVSSRALHDLKPESKQNFGTFATGSSSDVSTAGGRNSSAACKLLRRSSRPSNMHWISIARRYSKWYRRSKALRTFSPRLLSADVVVAIVSKLSCSTESSDLGWSSDLLRFSFSSDRMHAATTRPWATISR